MDIVTLNPFVAGPVVKDTNFIDREEDLRLLFNRLGHPDNPQSTAITGQPHIGKSSLLWKLADRYTQVKYLGEAADGLIVNLLDLHHISHDYTYVRFWQEALEPIRRHPGHYAVIRRLERAEQANYSTQTLRNLFSYLAEKRHQRLVLLLDEFERLLIHPNFKEPRFFASLRSLANNTGGLALVTASRLTVTIMNERGQELLDTGSPFFNNMLELHLRPFAEPIINLLLEQAGERFSESDRKFIRRMAGSSPFLLQAMAGTLFEIESSGEERLSLATQRFYSGVSHHFNDLWHSLDDQTRTAALMLSLFELGKRVLNQRFKNRDIKNFEAFEVELGKLAELGLAETIQKGGDSWNKHQWRISSSVFAYWIRDVVIAEARHVDRYDEWLTKQRYRSFLTQAQWEKLTGIVPGLRDFAVETIGTFVRSILEEGRP